MKRGLDTLCAQLANRGLVVVAYVLRRNSILLLLSGGGEIEFALGRLGDRTDILADWIATELEELRVRVVGYYELPVEIGERTAAWWRFLRWHHHMN